MLIALPQSSKAKEILIKNCTTKEEVAKYIDMGAMGAFKHTSCTNNLLQKLRIILCQLNTGPV
jgi:hypothetical protein